MGKYIQKKCKKHGMTKFLVCPAGSPRCLRCNSEHVAKRRIKVKKILIQEAGGQCIVCGYKRCNAALHFHHIKPENKSFALSEKGNTAGIDKMRKEAKKCKLVCANCHAEIETGLITI